MSTKRIQGGLYYDAERREMERRDREMIPKKLVIAMAALALSALALATVQVVFKLPKSGVPQAAAVIAERSVILVADGKSLVVTDPDGTLVTRQDNGAFISVVVEGLNRARKVSRVEGNPPVTISRLANGRLTLLDPASGWHVELTSFGAGNTAYWNWILPS
ncbi:photosynthetic complex assembly protein PuhC [Oceaniglobus roseus]|uniref:photosynthetic complex assembly protein PuhC n=1 Tax=Oceaniglobus roseus TaxID=1737570 RepID=UPI000C7F28F2|nr:photosynthetic complex assembly protein PuhC [Kandeliimicrobium roseum]